MAEEKKLNVLVIPDLFPRWEGDIQGIFVIDYIRSVAPFCNVQVFAPRLTGKIAGLSEDAVNRIPVKRYSATAKPVRGLAKFLLYRKLLKKATEEASKIPNIDIIHAHGSIISGTIASKIAAQKKIPFIVTEHIGPFSVVTDTGWKKRWTKKIIEKTDALLCVSAHQKKEILAADINPKQVFVTHNPVDTNLFIPPQVKTENKNILFVGRLDNFKGALRCATAFKSLCSEYPDWKFTIVGDGEDMPALREFIQTSKLDSRIILKGTLIKKEIAQEMQRADFLVFPSRHESFGLVIAEAMSCGLPVITTNQTAPKEFVDSSCGILINPDDIDAIGQALKKMIATHSRYNSETIRQKAVEEFGLEKFGKKLMGIYTSLLNKP
jgi:glycosyltransferase involved in cell wall biosynthesis